VANLESYHSSLAESRQWFKDNHPSVFQSFELIDTSFGELTAAIHKGKGRKGRSLVDMLPMIWLLQRQSFLALDALSGMQAYQAWLLVRPGLEGILMAARWADDKPIHLAWLEHSKDPDRYRDLFSAAKLRASPLPQAAELQGALGGINDLFAHPNPLYVLHHLKFEKDPDQAITFRFEYFDDQTFHWASVLAILHLLITLVDSMARLLAPRITNVTIEAERFGLAGFRDTHYEQAIAAASRGTLEWLVIHRLGLWPVDRGLTTA
jgi:hypothetical protein